MAFTAKVKVQKIEENGEYTRVHFEPDYNDERNKEWSYYTPSLDFHINMRKEVAEKEVKPGAAFTATFVLDEG